MEQYIANPILLLLSALWVLPWKGIALWQAARRSTKFWFILILVVNTFGILEILYIFVLKDVQWKKEYQRLRRVLKLSASADTESEPNKFKKTSKRKS